MGEVKSKSAHFLRDTVTADPYLQMRQAYLFGILSYITFKWLALRAMRKQVGVKVLQKVLFT